MLSLFFIAISMIYLYLTFKQKKAIHLHLREPLKKYYILNLDAYLSVQFIISLICSSLILITSILCLVVFQRKSIMTTGFILIFVTYFVRFFIYTTLPICRKKGYIQKYK
ncbi:hypothetical protein lbkm_0099 [Lachnospiraceae bacterium KM106-2]|nr:hypothetical protein lbkm_0099 [Lachnospiraceae bacterium KM106-2]